MANGKCYVGSAISIENRCYFHKNKLNRNIHSNKYLQDAWNKYGSKNFEFSVLEYVEDKTKLLEREQFWLDNSQCYDRLVGYNIRPNAYSSLGVKHTEETKKKMSESGILSKNKRNRDVITWPCELGAYCKCDDCKQKRNSQKRDLEIKKRSLLKSIVLIPSSTFKN